MARVKNLAALERRLRLVGKVRALTGLRIGAQGSHDVAGTDNPVMRDGRGMPYVPGSSFKGALRSAIESLVNGAGSEAVKACDPLEAHPHCCTPKRAEEDLDIPSPDLWKMIEEESCDVCLLFGRPDLAGRILVGDLLLVDHDDPRPPIEVRDCVAIDRDTETARDGRKYDLEVVPPGTAFSLELVIDNPEPYQLGLLAAGFDSFNEGFSRLGGGTTRGLGRIEIADLEARAWTARQMLGVDPETPGGPWKDLAREGREALKKRLGGG